jgi:hypothetical protein
MKKLFVTGALFLSLMGNTCYAIEFCKDVLERGNPGGPSASLKTWDEELIIGGPAKVDVDIWINDVPEKLITAGIYIEFDWSQMSVLSGEIYDPWDEEMSRIVPNPEGPGSYMVLVGNFGSVTPDRDGDIAIAKLRLDCEDDCNMQITVKTIPNFASVVGGDSSVTYDDIIEPNVFTIKEGTPTSTIPGIVCLSETLYGADSPEVNLLRTFRNNALSKTPEGRELIKRYYQLSPIIVNSMEKDEEFRQEVKEVIDAVLLLLSP